MTLKTQLQRRGQKFGKVWKSIILLRISFCFPSASNELNTRRTQAPLTTPWMEADYNRANLLQQFLTRRTSLVYKACSTHISPLGSPPLSHDVRLALPSACAGAARTPTCLAWLTQRMYWSARAEQLRVCWAFWR